VTIDVVCASAKAPIGHTSCTLFGGRVLGPGFARSPGQRWGTWSGLGLLEEGDPLLVTIV
jgi:hypothetical protein